MAIQTLNERNKMAAYLKIENPGVAPEEAFTLLGASTKRGGDNSATIGKFGTGNKQGIAVLLRNQIAPVVFAGNLKMEFGTRKQKVNDGLRDTEFNRVYVKFGGKDRSGVTRTTTEDLGFVLEHGSEDWGGSDLALREFVSNSIDRAVEEGESRFLSDYLMQQDQEYRDTVATKYSSAWDDIQKKIVEYRAKATDWDNVVIEVVDESSVRAKAGTTRIFVPLTNEVLTFYNNLGKWFLHFSEPELLSATILPKRNRNLTNSNVAVIYRRGVRVREFASNTVASLFDYNLENLKLDESRQVDDHYVGYEAARALSSATVEQLKPLFQSFVDQVPHWEHEFHHYGLDLNYGQKDVWNEAFSSVAGEDAVLSTSEGGEIAKRKGFKVVNAPESFVKSAEKRGLRTPTKVLNQDEQAGREVSDATPDALAAVEFAWDLISKHGLTNGKEMPKVKTYRKIMDGGSLSLGFYKDGIVYINQDIAASGSNSIGWYSLTQKLLVTALEQVTHHVTGATETSRDFQDFLLNLIVSLKKEIAGL